MNKYILSAITVAGLLMAVGVAYANPMDAGVVAMSDASSAVVAPVAPSLPSLESAAAVATPGPAEMAAADPLGTVATIVSDVRSGDWRHAAAGLLVLLMFGLAKVRNKFKWFSGDRGGAILVLALAMSGALATALYGSAAIDWRLFVGAISVAASSAGAFNLVKKIIWPGDKSDSQ